MDFSTTGKLPWQSKAFVGAFVSLLALVLEFFGFHVDKIALTNDTLQAISIISLIVSLWGTIVRTQPIVWKRATMAGGPFNPQAEVEKAIPVSKSEEGHAVLNAIIALVVCGLIGLIFASCHPTTPEAGGKVEKSESGKVIRDPEVPRVLHPSLSPLSADSPESGISSTAASETSRPSPRMTKPRSDAPFATLLRSLVITPGVDVGTNSHGQTIYGPSITLRGGFWF